MQKLFDTLKLAFTIILILTVGGIIFLYAMKYWWLMLLIVFGIPFLIVCYCIVDELSTEEEKTWVIKY